MNKTFKVLLASALLATSMPALKAEVLSGTILDTGTMRNTIILTTNRASVYGIEITATANTRVDFYDADATNDPYWGTNYVAASYVSRNTYASNAIVSSFVGYNGYTNWYTNSGVYTVQTTNAASTNRLNPLFSAVVAGNTYATYSVDALFARGIVAVASAGTNINIVINYRKGM